MKTTDPLKGIILQGQGGYSDDMHAFMLNDNTMVISNDTELVYLTKEQVMEKFNLVEKET
jgi:hypothetical protein